MHRCAPCLIWCQHCMYSTAAVHGLFCTLQAAQRTILLLCACYPQKAAYITMNLYFVCL